MSFKPLSNEPYAQGRDDDGQRAYVACLRAIHAEQMGLSEGEAVSLLERLADHCDEYAVMLVPGSSVRVRRQKRYAGRQRKGDG